MGCTTNNVGTIYAVMLKGEGGQDGPKMRVATRAKTSSSSVDVACGSGQNRYVLPVNIIFRTRR